MSERLRQPRGGTPPPVAILLCAGRGSRMGDGRTHKVCYTLAGVPAIRRLVAQLRAAGLARFVVVVGHEAAQVMACLADEPGVTFAYQTAPRGTADATRVGLAVVRDFALGDEVLICNGDKLLRPALVRRLLEGALEDVELRFVAQAEAANPDGARIAVADGRVRGIVERSDLALQRLSEAVEAGLSLEDRPAVDALLDAEDLHPRKRTALLEGLAAGDRLPLARRALAGAQLSTAAIRASGLVNAALYRVRRDALERSLGATRADNAQGELYLPDAVNQLCAEGRAEMLVAEQPEDIRTYSTIGELLQLQQAILAEEDGGAPAGAPRLRSVADWLAQLDAIDWAAIYGADERRIAERRQALRELLEAFARRTAPSAASSSPAPRAAST